MSADDSDEPPPPVRLGEDAQSLRMRRALVRGVLVWLALGVLGSVIVVGIQTRPRSHGRLTCMSNVSQLAGLYAATVARRPEWVPRSGQAMLLEWRRDGHIASGQELVLICPGDNHICTPDTSDALARYDAVDLDDPPDDLCSYAVRDFARYPVDPKRAGDEPVVACVGTEVGTNWQAHHKDAFVIGFADGGVKVFTQAELGIGPGAAPVVGPESPSPLLRVLCFRAAK